MFQGTYELMKVIARSEKSVTISRLTQKEAADPSTSIAALITLSSGFDKLIAIGEEVFSVNPVGFNGNYYYRRGNNDEQPMTFDVKPIDPVMAEMVMKWLKVKDKTVTRKTK